MVQRRTSVAILLLFLLAVGCATLPAGPTGTVANDPDACSFDSDCLSGNCQFGHCSPFSNSSTSNRCTLDSQCGTGSCQTGTCSPFPPSPPPAPGCSFDSQCPGGSCQMGSCSPFPPP